MATLSRGCTGSIIVSTGAAVGAAVVTSGMNLWRVAVGAAVGAIVGAGAAVARAAVAGAAVAGAAVAGAAATGAAVAGAAAAGAAVAALVGAAGAAVAAGVSSSSSPPQATMTIAISATMDSRINICHLLSHIGDFTYIPPGIFPKLCIADKQAYPPARKQ